MKSYHRFGIFFAVTLLGCNLVQAQTCNPQIVHTTPDSDFADAGNGTVRHIPTGLIWKRCSEGQTWDGITCQGSVANYRWEEAFQRADEVNAGSQGWNAGQTDWRIPNQKELRSIVERACVMPSINTAQFPATPSSMHWSGSPFTSGWAAWGVDFYWGSDVIGALSGSRSGPESIRLVRAGRYAYDFDAAARFVRFANETTKVSEAANNVVLKVNRSGVSGGAVSVAYATADGTATAGTDYVATAGTLNWADGDTEVKTISVPIMHDNVSEAAKTFSVALSSPTGIALEAPSSVTVSVYENVPAVPFVDISGNWAASYINSIYGAGITTGCGGGNYCPAQSVTRGQMAALIIRAKEGEPSTTCSTVPFTDVAISNGFCKYVKRMLDLNITTGCGSGNYCPSQNVTRDQMAAFIIRAVEGNPAAGYCGSTTPYSDVPASNGFCGHIKRMAELGITTGCGGGNYCPSQTVTRDQMAVFLARAFLGM
jgi:hypothetical protein